jgi:hypothetical protein
MRTVVRVVLAFLFGFIATYVVAVTAAFTYAHLNNVFDRDGGMSMGIIFLLGPALGLLGGILAGTFFPIWLGKRDAARVGGTPPPRQGAPGAHVAVVAIICGIVGYLVGRFVLWMMQGMSFESYFVALTVSMLPWILGLGAAGLAVALTRRGHKPETA